MFFHDDLFFNNLKVFAYDDVFLQELDCVCHDDNEHKTFLHIVCKGAQWLNSAWFETEGLLV